MLLSAYSPMVLGLEIIVKIINESSFRNCQGVCNEETCRTLYYYCRSMNPNIFSIANLGWSWIQFIGVFGFLFIWNLFRRILRRIVFLLFGFWLLYLFLDFQSCVHQLLMSIWRVVLISLPSFMLVFFIVFIHRTVCFGLCEIMPNNPAS